MYRLADFANLLEVAVGLHLAYSLIREVSHARVRKFERHFAHLNRYLSNFDESAQKTLRPILAELDLATLELNARLDPLVTQLTRLSIVAAIYGICVLAYSGFSPDTRVPLIGLVLLLAPATFPVAVFLPLSYVTARRTSITARDKSAKAFAEFFRLVQAGHLSAWARRASGSSTPAC